MQAGPSPGGRGRVDTHVAAGAWRGPPPGSSMGETQTEDTHVDASVAPLRTWVRFPPPPPSPAPPRSPSRTDASRRGFVSPPFCGAFAISGDPAHSRRTPATPRPRAGNALSPFSFSAHFGLASETENPPSPVAVPKVAPPFQTLFYRRTTMAPTHIRQRRMTRMPFSSRRRDCTPPPRPAPSRNRRRPPFARTCP